MSSSIPYVALSLYGAEEIVSQRIVSIKLSDIIRRTFANVMQVFQNWQQSFLWMDQYRISQSDPAEKETMIVKMDRVYKGADLIRCICIGIFNSG